MCYQPAQALNVGLGVSTLGIAGCEALGGVVVIQAFLGAVDPTITQRFLDRIIGGDAGLAGRFVGIDQPDLFFGAVMLAQPLTPGQTGGNRKGIGVFHICLV
jgi:hypothetical protein